ncbi:MAG: acyl-CoA reductase [Myxococcota bacterium]|nr:acyl-CoA reductase [Myxococcota bacterium]
MRLRGEGTLLRARPQSEVVDQLARVLDAWRDARGRWQHELAPRVAASGGFSEATVRRDLSQALETWSGDALRDVVRKELGGSDERGHELTSVLLAGCIPMPTLLQILLVLAVRSPALVKLASRDRVTAHLVRNSVAEVDAQLGRCIEVLEPDATRQRGAAADFFSSPCVVASGSDETIEAVRAQMTDKNSLIAYGHRLSIAVIGDAALNEETAAALASDVAAWDQLGCLSPAVAFVVGGSDDALTSFGKAVAAHLQRLEHEAPRGELDASTAASIRAERETARLRFASATGSREFAPAVHSSAGSEWTVVLEADDGAEAELRSMPLHRFLRIQPVRDAEALTRLTAPLTPWLSTLSTAGLSDAEHDRLATLGAERICRPGEMQVPPLGWHRDGLALLRPLIS